MKNFEIGHFSPEKAEKIKAALDGQSFMNFRVIVAPFGGDSIVSVETDYRCSQAAFQSHLIFSLATLIG